jgi:hypothetical protein
VTFVGFMLLFMSLWAGPQSTPPRASPTAVLRGIVRGPAGEPANEVKVRVENWYFNEGKPHFLTEIVLYTDQKGEFSVRVPAGVYDVIVSRPDCEPVAKKLKVISGKETIFKPQLRSSKLTEFIE